MKIRIFLYFFLLLSLPAFGQKINTWDGTYALKAFDENKKLQTGHFFICKTIPDTTVDFGNGEKINSREGLFGIRLHFGLFYLDVLE